MRIFVVTGLLLASLAYSCSTRQEKPEVAVPVALPDAPEKTEKTIRQFFPAARPARDLSDSLISYLNTKYEIPSEKMLLGVSTCVDDIIYTKNFHGHPEIKGPFHLGGLAGLPFTGISGLDAFAHHIPDSGAMILLVEPHIGYSEKNGWGYVLRHDQHEPSTCCGALMGTLAKLKAGKLKADISDEDYQGGKIAEYTLEHQQSILTSENPIIELTRVTSSVAENQIRAHVLDVSLEHVKFIVIITGVIINTDYTYTDYQYVDGISIYDVRKGKFVEEIKVK